IAQDAERPLVEPVEVLVEERGGRQHHLVWNGELEPGKALPDQPAGGRHRFVLQTRRPLARVRMDPRRRLVQRARPPHGNVGPLFNDRRRPSFRFLYTGAGLSVAASEFLRARGAARRFNAVTGYLAFEGSLRRDLRRSGNVTLARDRENHLLVGAATSLWWGEKVNRQRRRGRVRIGVDGSWLSPQSLDPTGGMRSSVRIAIKIGRAPCRE